MRLALLTLATLMRSDPVVGDAPDAARLEAMAARMAAVPIRVDLTTLGENEQRALGRLLEAA